MMEHFFRKHLYLTFNIQMQLSTAKVAKRGRDMVEELARMVLQLEAVKKAAKSASRRKIEVSNKLRFQGDFQRADF